MAKSILCCVQDSKVGYAAVMTFRSKGEAVRSFMEHRKDETSMVSKYPADYSLWCVGVMDDQSGVIETVLERLIGADELG